MRPFNRQPARTVVDRVAHVQRHGYVVLEDCIPRARIEEMRRALVPLLEAKVARFGLERATVGDGRDRGNDNVQIDFRPEGGNHDLNRWNMHLPSIPALLRDEVVAHPDVTPILDDIVGPDVVCFMLASDTPYPGSGFQNIHQDFPRFGLTVNIPLVDFTEENAPLEVWPGTHICNRAAGDVPFHKKFVHWRPADYEILRREISSQRMLLPAGSILIRDQRMVHRGTANHTEAPRHCLSIWYKAGRPSLSALSPPPAHRRVADWAAKRALELRRSARGDSGRIADPKRLNLGNLLGRLVDEGSGSDRDYRRGIDGDLWRALSADSRRMLRYATVTDPPASDGRPALGTAPSLLGSATLAALVLAIEGAAALSPLFGRRTAGAEHR